MAASGQFAFDLMRKLSQLLQASGDLRVDLLFSRREGIRLLLQRVDEIVQ